MIVECKLYEDTTGIQEVKWQKCIGWSKYLQIRVTRWGLSNE